MKNLFSFLLLLAIANIGFGQIYKWTDENGKTHIATTPPPKQYQKNVIIKQTSEDKIQADRYLNMTEEEKMTACDNIQRLLRQAINSGTDAFDGSIEKRTETIAGYEKEKRYLNCEF
jgi:hypothetical protein